MNPVIFRPNDIRGVVDQDFTAADFTLIGQGFAKYLLDRGVSRCVIGRDNRLSSPSLQSAFTEGLLASGIDVTDIGEVTTPMVYFARGFLKTNGGVCITASHNPPDQNGAKLCCGGGAIHEEEIYEVENNVRLRRFERGHGKRSTRNIVPDYLKNIRWSTDFKFIKAHLPITSVAVDSGNGLAGRFVPKLLRQLGLKVTELYSEPDGTFPHHLPDPALGQNMKELWHTCKDNKLDLGLAYDGDVDRLNVIDDQHVILWGDGIATLFSREILERIPGVEILYDVMCSPGLPEDISAHGGIGIMVPSGHSMVAHRLHRLHAPMAGEYSGHFYFSDGYLGFDDAIYATFRLLNILARSKSKVSSLLSDVPTYISSGISNIPVPADKKLGVITSLQKKLSDRYYVDTTSGARTKIGSCWASIHPSSTESYLRLVVWGRNEKSVAKTREQLISEINALL